MGSSQSTSHRPDDVPATAQASHASLGTAPNNVVDLEQRLSPTVRRIVRRVAGVDTQQSGTDRVLTKNTFTDLVGLPDPLVSRLYNGICTTHNTPTLTYEALLEALYVLLDESLLAPTDKEQTAQVLDRCVCVLSYLNRGRSELNETDLSEILSGCAAAAVAELQTLNGGELRLPQEDLLPTSPRIGQLAHQIFHSAAGPAKSGDKMISISQLHTWLNKNAPFIFKPLQTVISHRLLAFNSGLPSTETGSKHLPTLHGESEILSDGLVWLLSTFLPAWQPTAKNEESEAQMQWEVLFSARRDGYSINRFEYHTLKYPRPTLLIISGSLPSKIDANQPAIVVGAYIDGPWKKSRQFWGTPGFLLFQLEPTFRVHRAKSAPAGDHFAFFSAEKGVLGFGGEANNFNLSTDLQTATYQPVLANKLATYDFTGYEGDKLTFDVDDVEVIGLGGEKASQIQRREWKFEERDATRRADVNLHDQTTAKQILAMAGPITL
ncbi:uncharacterized protein SPPG_04032 [Spizellomyces punctatus DAOM BR117]|uniref:TLDc domain-containing protein n=1 Tax=Spizellomyces punctatus (strain DAOM BR117) TaxID=645134 RepID=A0A0L0HJ55_SPIPD|nr:uncharacterized protein SPPG_04032 [Spizellomyces punctatus DAOM BR117]KND00930.1 hypothetical protein SPPG_04032 [Spizellomyces punctatus DAOM BR117]|eukprot:XP_016608969.1 hypothetical protein SPPG_04032 [Spizellomyces punctatus DAOM BR117]